MIRCRRWLPTWAFLLLVLVDERSWLGGVATAFQYQHDTLEDCADRISDCTTSRTLWYDCPVSCSASLEIEGSMAEVTDSDPEAFYELPLQLSSSSTSSLEDYEGYVTVYAVVPLQYRGMAEFYYELLEHVAGIFPYTVQFLLLPWQESEDSHNNNYLTLRHPKTKAKVLLLQATNSRPQALEYLLHAKLVAGNPDGDHLWDDRVTIFLVSADGIFIERLISPTMTVLERRISVYLQQLSYSPEL